MDTTERSTPVYDGKLGELYAIFFANIVLTVITFGIYRFWAKTKTRRFLLGHVSLYGDHLEYTGTGGELFFGFLKALVIIIPLFVIYGVGYTFAVKAWGANKASIVTIVFYLVFFPLAFVAAYSGRRYRLSRVTWRGVRFGQAGSPTEYAILGFKTTLLTLVTLGFYHPYAQLRLHNYVLNNTQFGDRNFTFDGKGSDLFGTWVKCLLLWPFTLGLSLLWYAAAEQRYVTEHTHYDKLNFAFAVTGGDYLVLVLKTFAVIFFTLGLGLPIVLAFNIEFVCKRLSLLGQEDFTGVAQNKLPLKRTGEGLLDMLDADIAT